MLYYSVLGGCIQTISFDFHLEHLGKKWQVQLIDIILNGLKTEVGSYKSYVYIRYILENLWGCAVIGCACLVMPLDVLNKPYQIFAQELSEWLHVGPLQKRSHIWTAETMQIYLEFLGGEIRKRRRELELPHSARALILCDHTATTTTSTRTHGKTLS